MKGNADTSVCNLPHERGPCLAEIMSWGFDPSSGLCVQFIYGGCGGNENNFETKEACEQHCLGRFDNLMISIVNQSECSENFSIYYFTM